MPARVIVRPDRSFTFDLRTPATSYMLLKAANVPLRKYKLRGAIAPGTEQVGELGIKYVYEIAKLKLTEPRLSVLSEEAMVKCLLGQAKSIGLKIVP